MIRVPLRRSPKLAARRVRQTLSFDNRGRVLVDLALAATPFSRDELRVEVGHGISITCPNRPGARVPIYEVFSEDCYRLDEMAEQLGEASVVVDIGGQVGCFTVAVASRLPGATVHTYEASDTSAEWLSRNVRANGLGDRVHVHAIAVSDHAGTLEFVESGDASVLSGVTAPGGSRVEVPCIPVRQAIDDAGGTVDLLKLDTEGAEYAIVLGSRPDDWRGVRNVVMEYHDVPGHDWAELETFFSTAGLEVTAREPVSPRQGTAWLSRT